jgi:hypothetical protein
LFHPEDRQKEANPALFQFKSFLIQPSVIMLIFNWLEGTPETLAGLQCEEAFASGKQYFHEHPEITAAELYAQAQQLAEQRGWEYGGPIAGHLIGVFPHEKIAGDKVTLYVHPKNHERMRMPDASGRNRHWILEIHFVDRARQIGGFYEELLTVG